MEGDPQVNLEFADIPGINLRKGNVDISVYVTNLGNHVNFENKKIQIIALFPSPFCCLKMV